MWLGASLQKSFAAWKGLGKRFQLPDVTRAVLECPTFISRLNPASGVSEEVYEHAGAALTSSGGDAGTVDGRRLHVDVLAPEAGARNRPVWMTALDANAAPSSYSDLRSRPIRS
jgi:hypothetical protein